MCNIQSYEQASEAGIFSPNQMKVIYQLINGPKTQREVVLDLEDISHSVQPRFNELERAKVIRKKGRKENPLTGRENHLYELTGHIPNKPARWEPTKRAINSWAARAHRLMKHLKPETLQDATELDKLLMEYKKVSRKQERA